MSLYDRYKKEIAEEVKIDAFNIKDVAMLAPSKKHFWAARLNDHRIEIQDLKSKKAKIIRALVPFCFSRKSRSKFSSKAF